MSDTLVQIVDAAVADAYRRGLDQEDELISFAGRLITSDNHYKNILGIFPGQESVRFLPSAPFDDRLLSELPEVTRVACSV